MRDFPLPDLGPLIALAFDKTVTIVAGRWKLLLVALILSTASGFYGVTFKDYGQPIQRPLEQKWVSRHRLERTNPGDPRSPLLPCLKIALGRTKTTTASEDSFVLLIGRFAPRLIPPLNRVVAAGYFRDRGGDVPC